MNREKWPRLSRTLTGPRDPRYCQSCHERGECSDLVRCLEADDHDQFPTPPVIVVLCHACYKKRIDKHPRLYDYIGAHDPLPGTMPLCLDCRYRRQLTCNHPDQKHFGGPGLTITTGPTSSPIHLNCGRGRGQSYWIKPYYGPCTACTGKEALPDGQTAPLEIFGGQLYYDPGYSTEPDEETVYV